MHALDQLGAYHGLIIAIAILLAGMGLPLPIAPLLLAAGALAATGHANLAAAALLAPLLLILGDILWFYLGKRFGQKILGIVCRISLERDVCIRKTQETFLRHGLRVLLISRFVPGLGTLAPPLAGATGSSLRRFLIYEVAGTLLYTSLYISLGFFFAGQLDDLLLILGGASERLTAALLALLLVYVGFKLAARYWLVHQARSLTIPAAELKRKLAATPELLLVDLRGPADFAADPILIPGAKIWRQAQLFEAIRDLPQHAPIVLFCACPNQATSARLAMELRRKGFRNVHILQDGVAGWREGEIASPPSGLVPVVTTTT